MCVHVVSVVRLRADCLVHYLRLKVFQPSAGATLLEDRQFIVGRVVKVFRSILFNSLETGLYLLWRLIQHL